LLGSAWVPKLLPFSVEFIHYLGYTQIVEAVVGVPFGYEPNNEVKKVLEDFRDMVNFCVDYAYKRRITSYARLRKGVYEDWKERWGYSTHFCHSACNIALALLKTYRKKRKEGKPDALQVLRRQNKDISQTQKALNEPLTIEARGVKVNARPERCQSVYVASTSTAVCSVIGSCSNSSRCLLLLSSR